MSIQFPERLSEGSKIAICSTARRITLIELQPFLSFVTSHGFDVIYGATIGTLENQFSGSKDARISDLQTLLDDINIRAIIFARGGYGTVHLLDKLDWSVFKSNPKWLIGYSDLTALHLHCFTQTSIGSIHGPMPINFKTNTRACWENLMHLLKQTQPNHLTWPANKLDKIGFTEGILLGGNLSVIYSLMGSSSIPNMQGIILFLEDLDEYLYHLDRMLWNLKRNGVFEKINGLVIGSFSAMRDNEISFGKNPEEIIIDIVQEYSFPVAFGGAFGHCENNQPLVCGATVALNVSQTKNNLTYL